jgi:hypothetical protein
LESIYPSQEQRGFAGWPPETTTRALIFSKNRACQLELLLRSLKEQVTTLHDLSLAVLYAVDDGTYEEGYDLVRRIHPDVHLQLQDDRLPLGAQIRDLVRSERREFFSFFVDDIVAVRPFGWFDRQFALLRDRQDIAALSLRLNPKVSYCQPLRIKAPAPALDSDLTWEWTRSRSRLKRAARRLLGRPYAKGDWAGSMFVDGYVFRHAQFIPYFDTLPELPYVTKLESMMLNQPLPGRRVVCYAQSRIVNIVLNRVDTHSRYPHGGGSTEHLNSRFLAGDRLAYDHLKNMDNESCHVVVEPRWQA